MIVPTLISVVEWADRVLDATGDVVTGRLDSPDRWQEWASGFLRNNDAVKALTPDPAGFDDWREWAQRAFPALETLERDA